MAREISCLTEKDIPDLSRFLTAGFQTPAQADYAAPEVLRWKYLEPLQVGNATGDDGSLTMPRSYLARDENGRVIGHLGLCRTMFEGQALAAHGGQASTIHIIDWLGSPDHRAVGTSLMRKAHEGVVTQFGLGVSQAALVVGERIGYELRSLVPAYVRVLRPGYWMRTGGSSIVSRGLRLARDAARRRLERPITARTDIVLERVVSFGDEISPVVEKARLRTILTRRDAPRLNNMLRFPRQTMTGWHVRDGTGALRGFALLNLVPTDQGRTRTGKIVDCLLDDADVPLWQAAILALTHELERQGAELALAYASTLWVAEALRQNGYQSRFAVKFHIRDRQSIIPRDAAFHLTPLEGDYAYT